MLDTGEEVSSLRLLVAMRIHNHMAQHNAQYAELMLHWGYSIVYYAQSNSCIYEIML